MGLKPIHALALGALALLGAARPAAAWNSPAPDVVLYCTPAMVDALRVLAQRYTGQTQAEVHIFVAPPDGLIGLIKHRARDDVVVADAATLETLAAGAFIRRETIIPLGRDPYVLIAKSGAVLPPGAGAGDLVAARATVLPDPTTAATFDGAAVLHEALPAVAAPAPIGVYDTPAVLVRVRADDQVLGLVHQTEAGSPGVTQVAKLAAAPTVTEGALVTMGQSANAAGFLAFLNAPASQATLRSAGLEPSS